MEAVAVLVRLSALLGIEEDEKRHWGDMGSPCRLHNLREFLFDAIAESVLKVGRDRWCAVEARESLLALKQHECIILIYQ